MSQTESAKDSLAYVARTLRRSGPAPEDAVIYFLWAILVPIGLALFDFKPGLSGLYWFVVGPLGGAASWWLGRQAEKRHGAMDHDLGRRYGWHWSITGIGFVLAALPMATGTIDPANGACLFLLVGGLCYLLAGIHLDRGILPSGYLMLLAYVVLLLAHPPYGWTVTGGVIAAALVWSGLRARAANARAGQ